MKIVKTYVEVYARFDSSGKLIPKRIVWEDGWNYDNDYVMDIRQSTAMKVGGQGDRYTISVNGRQRYLYFRRCTNNCGPIIECWFVEVKVACWKRMIVMENEVFAIEFDGTLSLGGLQEVSPANVCLMSYLLDHKRTGEKLILWTCRAGKALDEAITFCAQNGL